MKNKQDLVLGIDIGGSKIRAVLYNGKKVLAAREIKTPKNLTALKRALRKLGEGITKIGIAVPGRANGTTFVSATNISYIKNLDFKKLFPGAKIKVDHDARCFARAELKGVERRGQEGGDRSSFFFLTLGTGVGRVVGEIKNGKPVIRRVREFEYPERWEKKYQKIRDSGNNRALVSFLAKKLARRFKEYKLSAVVIGGGVAKRKGFLGLLRREFSLTSGISDAEINLKILPARLGKNSVAIGAALLFS